MANMQQNPAQREMDAAANNVEQEKAAAGQEIGNKVAKALVDNVAKPLAEPVLKAALGSLKLPGIG